MQHGGSRLQRSQRLTTAAKPAAKPTAAAAQKRPETKRVKCGVPAPTVRVKHFQTIHHYSVDVAHGLVLLFGIGTRALPSWDSRTRWNNLLGGLAVSVTAGPSDRTISPHPSSREGHHSTAGWSSISSYCIGSCIALKPLRLP